MEIIPAIDLKSGLCVRLYQGDYSRETVYSDDPVAVALRWEREGASRLHVVDLDGAVEGLLINSQVIQSIAASVGIPVQVGGGIRDFETADELIGKGVDRVVLGTAAVRDPGLVSRLCAERGSDRVVVAVDARDGMVAIRGWTEGTMVRASRLVEHMSELGAKRFIYTDISRDGTLTEPNFESIRELQEGLDCAVIASGGISSVEHVVRLAAIGVEGAILGRALYTGDLDLGSAIDAASTEQRRL